MNDLSGLHEDLFLEFESAWQSAPPSISAFVSDLTDADREHVLDELVMIDLEHRLKRGENVDAMFYLEQFPELSQSVDRLQRLLVDELQMQSRFGKTVSLDDVQSRCGQDTILANRIWETLQSKGRDESDLRAASVFPGDHIGPYRLEEKIGTGSFSTVYRATDTRLNRDVAIKFFSLLVASSKQLQARLQLEAQLQALLEHDGIAPLHDVGDHNGQPFLVSRFVRGQTLESALNGERQSDFLSNPLSAAAIVADLAAAVHHAHQRGVVHRDIKPANVVLEDSQPTLLDFGLARSSFASQCMTQEGDMLGTPAYMSPEQAAGKSSASDARTDIHALGAVLYHMVCGRLPFEGTTSAVLHQILHDAPTKPSLLNRNITTDLQVVILKCLEKEPGDRYSTTHDLECDLRHVVAGLPIKARPVGFFKSSARWAIKRPVLSLLAAGCLLLTVFLGGMASTLFRVSAERDRAQDAERLTEKLLGERTLNMGELALQRGEASFAVGALRHALVLGVQEEMRTRLNLMESHFILRELHQAAEQAELCKNLASDRRQQGELLLWKAQFALDHDRSAEDAKELIQQTRQYPLSLADQCYADALLAESTPQAIELLRSALDSNPFHFRARQMLIVGLLGLAKFESCQVELLIAKQLFPESPDVKLLNALYLSCTAQLDASRAQLSELAMSSDEITRWESLCRFLDDFCNRPKIGLRHSMGSTSLESLLSTLSEFSAEHLPTLASRNWHLPLAVETELSDALDSLNAPEDSAALTNVPPLVRLAVIHPESTVNLFCAETWLSQTDYASTPRDEILFRFDEARRQFRAALDCESFLPGEKEYAHFGLLSIAALEQLKFEHRIEENKVSFREVSPLVDTQAIDRISVARLYGIAALTADDRPQSRRWFSRQHELAEEAQDVKSITDALFHLAVTERRDEDWIEVHRLCSSILEIDPTRDDASKFVTESIEKFKLLVGE